MTLFELAAKIKLDTDDYEKGVKGAKDSFEGFSAWTIAKGQLIADGIVSAGKALANFGKQAINSFAESEQLIGGVKKIFDEFDNTQILNDAANAYKNLGLSANQYLRTINDVGATFAATMGDEAGYRTATKGLQAISDYASGTGKNVDELSNKFTLITRSTASYQSIADQFSGILPATSKDFLEQAQAAGLLSESYTQLTQVPVAEYQAAVAEMLTIGTDKLGLTGNTAAEAATTISGSMAAARAAFENFTAGLADENANTEELLNQLVESVVIAGGNIVPRVGEILGNIGTLLIENAPIMLEQGINQLTNFLLGLDGKAPDIIAYVGQLVVNMGGALLRSAPRLLGAAADLMFQLLEEIVHAAVDIGENLVKGFWKGIQNLAGWVRDKVKGFFKGIVDSVKNTLDIHSPSGESEWMAEMFAKGFAVGWDKNFPAVKKGIINDLDFGTASVNATASYDGKNGKFGGNGVIGKTVNVIQNIYSEAKTAADLMEEAIYNQEKAVLLSV